MCWCRQVHFERCGDKITVWKICDNGKRPKIIILDVKNGNYPQCEHYWEEPAISVTNCCSFECCVHDVETQQESVRKYEVVLRTDPGARYGQEYGPSVSGNDSEQRVSDMNNSRLAQNYSLQRALLHVGSCCEEIQPGSSQSRGYVTESMLQILHPLNPMTLETQLTRIWNAFSVDMAQGIRRAVHSGAKSQAEVVERLKEILTNQLKNRNNGDRYRGRILAKLIYLGLPTAQTASIKDDVKNPPPVPDFEGDEGVKMTTRVYLDLHLAHMADPQQEWQTVLNSNPVQQVRDAFLGRIVTLDNFGLLGL